MRGRTRRSTASSSRPIPSSASFVMPRATLSSSARMRLALGVSHTCALRLSSALRTRRMRPAFSMLRSAITVVGSIMPTRSDSSRCDNPSSVQSTRRKYHCPRVTP